MLVHTTLAPTPSRLHQRGLWIVRGWYWLAPGFFLVWIFAGVDLRFPFLHLLPGARPVLYAVQMLCVALIAFRPRLTAVIGTLESSLSIGLLIVTTWMAYWGMFVDETARQGEHPFTPENVASLVASAVVLTISYGSHRFSRR